MRFISGKRHVDPGEALYLGQRKIDHAIVAEGLAHNHVFRGVPPQISITSRVAISSPAP